MAIASTVISVTTTPTAILGPATTWGNSFGATPYDPKRVTLRNDSTANQVYLGSSALTTAGSGLALSTAPGGGALTLTLTRAETLHAITSAGITASVSVIVTP